MGVDKIKSILVDLQKQYDLLEISIESEDSKNHNDKHYDELENMQNQVDELINLCFDILDAYNVNKMKIVQDLERKLDDKIGSVI